MTMNPKLIMQLLVASALAMNMTRALMEEPKTRALHRHLSTTEATPRQTGTVDVVVNIEFDSFPAETGWEIVPAASGGEAVVSFPIGRYDFRNKTTAETVTLNVGEEYNFIIFDSFGDGMCCTEPGAYIVLQGNTTLVIGGGRFGLNETTAFTPFGRTDSTDVTPAPIATSAPVADPAPDPTSTPIATTPAPVPVPLTPAPMVVAEPTLAPTSNPQVPLDMVDVNVVLVFDGFPQEIGWSISSVATEEIVASAAIGTYLELTEGATEVVALMQGEDYVFVIEDSFQDGLTIPNLGAFVVLQGETELVSGNGDFGSEAVVPFSTLIVAVVTPAPVLAPATPATMSPATMSPAPATSAPISSAPATSAPISPAPVTPAPITPATVTSAPVPSPTAEPITASPVISNGGEDVEVTIVIGLDGFPEETGWKLTRLDTGEDVFSMAIGTYQLLSGRVSETLTLEGGVTYEFTILDLFGDGLTSLGGDEMGTYSINQGTTELTSGGGNFGKQETKTFTPLN